MSALDGLSPAELLELYKTASPYVRSLIRALMWAMGIPV